MISRLILLFLSLIIVAFCFSNEKLLQKGDSLFSEQKYTEAYQHYEQLFARGLSGSSMLLKMAFIKEGLGEYAEALYYLDSYYKKSADRSVVQKINQISEANNLLGYQYNDVLYFKALLLKYRPYILVSLVSVLILFSAYIFKKRKGEERPVFPSVLNLVVGIALILFSHFISTKKEGIIVQGNTLLRSGPSAGAEPVETIQKGHKVDILEETPVWTKVVWDGEAVYVRKGRLRII